MELDCGVQPTIAIGDEGCGTSPTLQGFPFWGGVPHRRLLCSDVTKRSGVNLAIPSSRVSETETRGSRHRSARCLPLGGVHARRTIPPSELASGSQGPKFDMVSDSPRRVLPARRALARRIASPSEASNRLYSTVCRALAPLPALSSPGSPP